MQTNKASANIKQISLSNTSKGFSILESMIALALLATIMLSIVLFNTTNFRKQDAKILSSQTEAFANAFAKYMNHNLSNIQSTISINQTMFLSPQAIGQFWPIDLAKSNMYKQVPCVAISRSSTGNLEAIMYYVGGRSESSANAIDIVRSASMQLGDKGGILLDGAITGNSGWKVPNNSSFLSGAGQCGGNLTNNSIAVNLDLLPEWNRSLQQTDSILRGLDNESGLMSLPGHMKNSNTLKSNLYFGSNNGVILDNSDESTPTKLAILYSGRGTGAATLGLSDSKTTTITGDTFKPNVQFEAGDSCNPEELGKTVADKGVDDETNQVLARSTLICTQNDMLCGKGNTCYLPTLANKIVFQNKTSGIQNASGYFTCPKSVPFAVDVQTGILGVGQIYVIANKGGSTSPNSIQAVLDNSGQPFNRTINCPTSGCNPDIYTDFRSTRPAGQGELDSIDLATHSGNSVINTSISGSPSSTPVPGSVGEYTTTIGYQIQLGGNCSLICSNLGSLIGSTWQVLGTQRQSRVGKIVVINNQQLGCACERSDFLGNFVGQNANKYTGIALVIGSFQPAILSATCSNIPTYYQN